MSKTSEPPGTPHRTGAESPLETALETTLETGARAGTRTIAQVAVEFGVTHRTIRFYEDQGLIQPERRGTQRIFHPRDRVRLGLVLRGKRLGFDLGEIRRIVDMYDTEPGEVGQLRYLVAQIDARRAELEQRRRDIEVTLAELDDVERRCRATLEHLTVTERPPGGGGQLSVHE